MNIALIGNGAIAGYLQDALRKADINVRAILVRPERLDADSPTPPLIAAVADLPDNVDLVIDCAGHAALHAYGADILRAGHDLVTVSLGALADDALHASLTRAGAAGGARLHLATGAIGALDCLRAARCGTLDYVRYTGRKPPLGWQGSAAEDVLDLPNLTSGAHEHFSGTARAAALAYPKNANVAAAVALAGLGFDATEVALIADADARANIHEITAAGDFGSFTFRIEGATLPDNPRTSALAAMSVLSAIKDRQTAIHF
jgi:aspartate dehydrogenase